MKRNLTGEIIYMALHEINDFVYDLKKINKNNLCKINEITLIAIEGENFKKVNFNIPHTDDYYGGYVKGFLYKNDKKFLGTFYHTKDANAPNEKMNGMYIEKGDEINIRGRFYNDSDNAMAFYIYIRPEI